jgi:hypothetical protein
MTGPDDQTADDAAVMKLWRECGLPEYFLGNGGTNHRLVAFAQNVSGWSDAQVAKLWDERDELRRALEPFAKDADRLRNYPDDYPYSLPTTPITVGDFRRALEALRITASETPQELPDDLRAPLHSLQADLDWLVARIRTEDDEVVGLCKDSMRSRLSQIEEAAYRLHEKLGSAQHQKLAALLKRGNPDDRRRLRQAAHIMG